MFVDGVETNEGTHHTLTDSTRRLQLKLKVAVDPIQEIHSEGSNPSIQVFPSQRRQPGYKCATNDLSNWGLPKKPNLRVTDSSWEHDPHPRTGGRVTGRPYHLCLKNTNA